MSIEKIITNPTLPLQVKVVGSAVLCAIGGGLIYKVKDHPDYETYLAIFSTTLATLTAITYWNGRKCDALWGMGLITLKSIALLYLAHMNYGKYMSVLAKTSHPKTGVEDKEVTVTKENLYDFAIQLTNSKNANIETLPNSLNDITKQVTNINQYKRIQKALRTDQSIQLLAISLFGLCAYLASKYTFPKLA